jgi:hypothetical protein
VVKVLKEKLQVVSGGVERHFLMFKGSGTSAAVFQGVSGEIEMLAKLLRRRHFGR